MIVQQGPNEDPLVRELQKILKSYRFYSGTIDDTFGPETEAAVIAFQKALGLDTSGIEEILKSKSSWNIKMIVRLVQVQSQICSPYFALPNITITNFYQAASTSKTSISTSEKT